VFITSAFSLLRLNGSPAAYGEAIVIAVHSNHDMLEQWNSSLEEMRNSLRERRERLADLLDDYFPQIQQHIYLALNFQTLELH